MPHSRAERVGDLIRQELSELLLRAVEDPRVGMVTITDVTVSPDLRAARIYVVSRDGEGVEDQTLEGLRAARGFLRGELGRRLRLKNIPDLAGLWEARANIVRTAENALCGIQNVCAGITGAQLPPAPSDSVKRVLPVAGGAAKFSSSTPNWYVPVSVP